MLWYILFCEFFEIISALGIFTLLVKDNQRQSVLLMQLDALILFAD